MKRRNFIKKALGAGAIAAASSFPAPAVAKGKIQWKMVTCWPKNFPALGTGVQRIVDSIYAMSDEKFEIKGEIISPF